MFHSSNYYLMPTPVYGMDREKSYPPVLILTQFLNQFKVHWTLKFSFILLKHLTRSLSRAVLPLALVLDALCSSFPQTPMSAVLYLLLSSWTECPIWTTHRSCWRCPTLSWLLWASSWLPSWESLLVSSQVRGCLEESQVRGCLELSQVSNWLESSQVLAWLELWQVRDWLESSQVRDWLDSSQVPEFIVSVTTNTWLAMYCKNLLLVWIKKYLVLICEVDLL